MTKISQLSEVDPSARLGEGVEIGPFCCIGPNVTIGDRCVLHNNVTVIGHSSIGADNELFPFVVIGTAPQDLKYRGGPTRVEIGDRNVFREYVTVHPGTEAGGEVTRVGSDSLFMVGSHIAHDCLLGDKVMLGNFCQLAGHVCMEEHSVISAMSGVHHFVTIGRYAFVGGLTAVKRDIPPFTIFYGQPGEVRGINEVGISRNGFDEEQVAALKRIYRRLFTGRTSQMTEVDAILAEDDIDENVLHLCRFLKASQEGKFGRCREKLRDGETTDWKPVALGEQFTQRHSS